MLRYKVNARCDCCGSPRAKRAYRWHSFRYCLTCLHSIGVNAAGNPCTRKQYRDAWHAINEGEQG